MVKYRIVVRNKICRAAVFLVLMITVLCDLAHAQTGSNKATRISEVLSYPMFFHGQHVVIHGSLTATDNGSLLTDDNQSIRVLGIDTVRGQPVSNDHVEIQGTFWDVGRLDPKDPRVKKYDISTLSQNLFGNNWPVTGDLLIIVADTLHPIFHPTKPTLRDIALQPDRYKNKSVTIIGRLRGRNLYADLPEGPNLSRFDFVIKSASGSIWITGKEPKGDNFHLDITKRADTGNWLAVTGIVKATRGLVWIEATRINLASPPPTPQKAPPATIEALPPEVIFSSPLPNETDVSRKTTVRIQFSRDMNPDSFDGRVHASYLKEESLERGEPNSPEINIAVEYRRSRRALTIVFTDELDRFRAITVDLLDGIETLDGAPLAPWVLTFNLGGS